MAFGFDNNADMQRLTAGLLERYLSAASRVARLAIGDLVTQVDLDDEARHRTGARWHIARAVDEAA